MNPNIFPYRDAAGAERFGDPLLIDHRLRTRLGDVGTVVAAFYDPNPEVAYPATMELASAVCFAFGLGPPFDMATGQGEVTVACWRECLFSWQWWMEKNAGGASSSPTCSKPTEQD
jgi:hypothetical protein